MSERAAASAASAQAMLIGTMALWGLNLSAVKLLTATFDPLLVAALRMVIAFGALTALMRWQRCPWPRFSVRQWAAVAVCAALMVYANQILLAEGLLRSSATNGALIMALSPLVSAVMVSIAYGERLTRGRLAGIVLGFGGVAALTLTRPGAELATGGWGDLMIISAMASFAVGSVIIQRIAIRMDPLSMSWAIYTLGAAMLVLHTLLSPVVLEAQVLFPGVSPWLWLLYSGVAATALGSLIWNRAIGVIGAARTALYSYWIPIFGIAFAVLFLGEPLTAWHGVGLLAVLGGTFLGTRRRPAH